MKKLTENQKTIWNYIQKFLYTNNTLPKINTIAKEFNMTYDGMRCHLVLMEKKGYVKLLKESRGGYTITKHTSKLHFMILSKENLYNLNYWKMYCYIRFIETSKKKE